MRYYHLIHNGYKIDHFNSEEEVNAEISARLKEHSNLNPTKVSDQRIDYTPRWGEKKPCRNIIYRYDTLYMEVFTIVEGDI